MSEVIRVGALELRFLIDKYASKGALDMFEMTVPPNARMPVPHHHRDWEETVYGLSGVTTWTIDGREHAIGPGDSAFVPRGIVHAFDNRGTEPARCLCVLTPGVLGPDYFRETGTELAAATPDLARLRAIMARYGLIPVAA